MSILHWNVIQCCIKAHKVFTKSKIRIIKVVMFKRQIDLRN